MSFKNSIGHFAWMIGTWVLFYAFLCLAKVNNAKQITIIFMLINLLIFPFSIEYIGAGQHIPASIGLVEVFLYIGLFYVLGPLSVAMNVKFLYLMLIGG
jgi:hypothetical protein